MSAMWPKSLTDKDQQISICGHFLLNHRKNRTLGHQIVLQMFTCMSFISHTVWRGFSLGISKQFPMFTVKNKKTNLQTTRSVKMIVSSCYWTPAGWLVGHQSSPCSGRLTCCFAQSQAETGIGWAATECGRHSLVGSDQTGWLLLSDL